jgi:exopolysaccharide biosynthesis polyprenyl glycosylphosphotransferase
VELQVGHGRILDREVDRGKLNVRSRRVLERILLPVALVATDSIAICAAFAFAYVVRFKLQWSIFYAHTDSPLVFYSSLVFWLAPLMIVIFAAYQLYVPRQMFDGPREYARVSSAATLSILLVVVLSFLFDDELVISRGWLVISWVAMIVFVSGSRFLLRRVVYALRRRGYILQRIAIVASGADLGELIGQFQARSDTGLDVVAVIDPADLEVPAGSDTTRSPLRRIIEEHKLEEIIVSSASVPQSVLAGIVRDLSQMPTELHLVPGMYEIQTTGIKARDIRGIPLVTLNKVRITGFDFVLKRTLDYLVASTVLLLLSPLLLSVAVLVRLSSPGPIFHRRKILGERGRRFDALKFRTMYVNGDQILEQHPGLAEELRRNGKLVNDPRITPLGRWLRRWSIDEFPQLFNVLRGQMSLVGPRMITEEEHYQFGHWRENLITVKPGITGLWQVSGRSNLGYEERVRLDMFYIRSYSIWRDVEILLRTLPAVCKGTGAY